MDPGAGPRAWPPHRRRPMPGFRSTHGRSDATTADVRQRAVIGTSPFHPSLGPKASKWGRPGIPLTVDDYAHGSEKFPAFAELFCKLGISHCIEVAGQMGLFED